MTRHFSRKKILALAVLVGTSLLSFQNCARINPPEDTVQPSSTMGLPFNHPDVDIQVQGAAVVGQILIGDKDYLESTFIDIFGPSDAPSGIQGFVKAVLYQELAVIQGSLGRSCDIYETGDATACAGLPANIQTKMNSVSSSIQEAGRIQVCRRLIANDSVLAYVVGQVKGNQNTPNETSIAAAVRLFYPANDEVLDVGNSLEDMDHELALHSESVNDRWRLIFLTLCEAPTWQIL